MDKKMVRIGIVGLDVIGRNLVLNMETRYPSPTNIGKEGRA